MASTETKKAHLAPQNYLERFATEPGKIWVFDKSSLRTYGCSIKDVAQERYFYDVIEQTETGPIRSQAVEHYLADAEGFYKDCLDRLLAAVAEGALPQNLKHEMAFFIMLQVLRTQEARRRMTQFFESGSQQIIARAHQDGYNAPISDLSAADSFRAAADASRWHAAFLDPQNVWDASRPLLDHIWIVGINHSERLLYTSDNPVIGQNEFPPTKIIAAGGLVAVGTEVQLPLTSRHVLCLFERTHFGEHRALNGQAIYLTDEQIDRCNSFQSSSAERQVFCGVDDFDLARRYCAMVPECRNPDRHRLNLSPDADSNDSL